MKEKQILFIVCEYYNLTEDEILSKPRCRVTTKPRQMLQYVLKHNTKLSLTSIGWLTNKNHATVINSIKSIQNLIDTDPVTKLEYEELKYMVDQLEDEPKETRPLMIARFIADELKELNRTIDDAVIGIEQRGNDFRLIIYEFNDFGYYSELKGYPVNGL